VAEVEFSSASIVRFSRSTRKKSDAAAALIVDRRLDGSIDVAAIRPARRP
jgi:hypothetical protein